MLLATPSTPVSHAAVKSVYLWAGYVHVHDLNLIEILTLTTIVVLYNVLIFFVLPEQVLLWELCQCWSAEHASSGQKEAMVSNPMQLNNKWYCSVISLYQSMQGSSWSFFPLHVARHLHGPRKQQSERCQEWHLQLETVRMLICEPKTC